MGEADRVEHASIPANPLFIDDDGAVVPRVAEVQSNENANWKAINIEPRTGMSFIRESRSSGMVRFR